MGEEIAEIAVIARDRRDRKFSLQARPALAVALQRCVTRLLHSGELRRLSNYIVGLVAHDRKSVLDYEENLRKEHGAGPPRVT